MLTSAEKWRSVAALAVGRARWGTLADAICVNSTARYSAGAPGGAVERFGSRTEVALLQFATALVGDGKPVQGYRDGCQAGGRVTPPPLTST